MSKKQAYVLYFIVIAASLSALLLTTAYAATYNFYFNNTEQGNNSTAAPNINATPTPVPATPTTPAVTSDSPSTQMVTSVPGSAAASTTTAETPALTPVDPNHKPILRVGLGYMGTSFQYDPATNYPYTYGGNYDYTYSNNASAPGLSLEVFLSKELSLLAGISSGIVRVGTGGLLINGLLNFYPVTVSVGSIDVEVGLSGGVMIKTYGPLLPMTGPRVNVHLAKNWDLAIGARFIFGKDNELYNGHDYENGNSKSYYGPSRGWSYDAGVQFKFL